MKKMKHIISCKISGSSQFIKRLFENKEIQFD